LALALATTGAAPRDPAGEPRGLPAIVFVSRNPVPGEPSAIPGLGPHHRAVAPGGRLLVRERDGRVRELLAPGAFHDVSDPSVSPDARRVAFAGVTHRDSAWRIWVVGLGGGDPRPVTESMGTGPPVVRRAGAREVVFERYDDLDPCWIDDSSLVFASTRFPQRAQYADVRATNLFLTTVPSHGLLRITSERNGAEEPAMDWTTGRLVFSRWWFNRYRAAEPPAGITADPHAAIAGDTVNLWQAMDLSRSVRLPRLAAGDLRTRRGTMGYQATVLSNGSIAAVYAANLGLSPGPVATGIHVLSRTFGPERRLAGAIVSGRAGDAYSGAQGLAPPSACSPAGLPDGRVLFSYAPGARGDLGLYVARADGSRLERVIDLPGTLELDAAPVVRRPPPPRETPLAVEEYADPAQAARDRAAGPGTLRTIAVPPPPAETPPAEMDGFPSGEGARFRFHDLDVFADGPPGAATRGAARRTPGARLRFFATLARPEREGGDSAFLVREVPVSPSGEVNERNLPAGVPMFEQLVGPDGRVLMTAHGPAHVAGFNAGANGVASRCVGCHLGHSTLPLTRSATRVTKKGR
jgi:hypothetical protein